MNPWYGGVEAAQGEHTSFLTFSITAALSTRRRQEREDRDARQEELLTAGFIVEVPGLHDQSVGPLMEKRDTRS